MGTRSVIITLSALLLASCSCPEWEIVEKGSHNIVIQKKGRTLGYSPTSGRGHIQDKGFIFKDHNRNGRLDVYEDWRCQPAERAKDLAGRLSIKDIAGLMLYSKHQTVPQYREYDPMKYTYNGKPWLESGADTTAIADNQLKFL